MSAKAKTARIRPGTVHNTRSNVFATVDNVSPFGPITPELERRLAELVALEVGESLDRFHGWSLQRFSIDHTALVTLHKS